MFEVGDLVQFTYKRNWICIITRISNRGSYHAKSIRGDVTDDGNEFELLFEAWQKITPSIWISRRYNV